jgi:hypothetical protein
MSDLVGDTSHLNEDTVDFSATHELRGLEGSGHFSLVEANGFKQLIGPRASVKIVSETLGVEVIGTPTAEEAVSVHVAVLPSTVTSFPTTRQQIATVAGSTSVTDSVYRGSERRPLRFSVEVAHQIKPKPQVGESPEVAYWFKIVGGTQTSSATLKVTGQVRVQGVGFVQTW